MTLVDLLHPCRRHRHPYSFFYHPPKPHDHHLLLIVPISATIYQTTVHYPMTSKIVEAVLAEGSPE
eukprot:scaffold23460_cov131-Skeletonema_marinoi.AAC.2